MAQLVTNGLGSGLDINGLVAKLVQSERAPTEQRLNATETRAQSRLSAYGGLKSALSAFQDSLAKLRDTGLYQGRKATVSDTERFSVSADMTAAAGNYSIQSQQLASRHKIASAAFSGDDATVGTGTLTITVGDNSTVIAIGSENNTLSGIRDAINNAADNPGVSAAIIRDENGSRLIFTADSSGADNAIRVSAETGVDDSGDLGVLAFDPGIDPQISPMLEKQAALDAILVIDGFTARSADNVFDEVIEGVSLTLQKADPDVSHSLDIRLDQQAVRKAVQQFVDSFNSLRTTLNTLTAYDPETRRAGLLQGDSATTRLAVQLREALSATVANADPDMDTLAEIGITTNFEDGKLQIDTATLDGLIESNFVEFSELLGGDSGIAAKLSGVADIYTRFEGILDSRRDGMTAQIDRISNQREALDKRMAIIEARYMAQFTALDTLLGELNQTSNFLSSQLDQLPGFTFKK